VVHFDVERGRRHVDPSVPRYDISYENRDMSGSTPKRLPPKRRDVVAQTRDRDVGRFDRWASAYDDDWLQGRLFEPVHRATVAAAARAVDDPARILDVGCGTGQLLARAAERFPDAELAGIDPAAGMVRRAGDAAPVDEPIRLAQACSEAIPFPDGSFDLVLSTMSFHHWADQRRGLREVRRVLAPEGAFVLTDAVVSGVPRWILSVWRPGRFHGRAELAGMLREAGLRVVEDHWAPDLHFWKNGVRVTSARPASRATRWHESPPGAEPRPGTL